MTLQISLKNSFQSFLIFADDLKLNLLLYSIDGCAKLQSDFNRFYSWCTTNGLSVSAEKCSQITFSRLKLNLKFNYTINSSDLTIVTQIKDLGILLSNDQYFNNHINMMCNKALRVLGFIRRNCSEFKNSNCIKVLYFLWPVWTLTRPIW
jgi:hypothetical protein